MAKKFICPSCQKPLTKPHAVHNCMRKLRTDAGKARPERGEASLETGAASLRISLKDGSITVRHGDASKTILVKRTVPKNWWREQLWPLLSGESKCTENGFDPAWIAAINGGLADRETGTVITDITGDLWDAHIGPMIDAIEDGKIDLPRSCR